jgi:translation initiation factor IF-2
MLELKAQEECRARGVVVDSKLDRGRGSIATVLLQMGTLKVGDCFVSGKFSGKVRALLDERGRNQTGAGPSDAVQILGFDGTPQAGDNFTVTESEKEAKSISLKRQQLSREQSFRQIHMMTLDQISQNIKFGETQELPLVIKGDVHGSVEALSDSLMKLRTDEVSVNVLHKGVGAVTEWDVLLAAASKAVIIGFHVHASKKARELAEQQQVEIKSYRIIYDVIDDIKNALEGLLRPDTSEEITGEAEVRDVFKISTVGAIAGCHVTDGKIERAGKAKVFREGVEIFDSEVENLKRFKEDAKEVVAGYECGIKIKNFNDIKVGDIIQIYRTIEIKRQLEL